MEFIDERDASDCIGGMDRKVLDGHELQARRRAPALAVILAAQRNSAPR